MGLFNFDWSSVNVTNIGINEAMINIINECSVTATQTIKNVSWDIKNSTADRLSIAQNIGQVDIKCMVNNQIDVLTSQLWAVRNTSSAAAQLLSAMGANVSKLTNYNDFANYITENLKNEFVFDTDQTMDTIYIDIDQSKIGVVVLSQSSVQNNVTGAFFNMSKAVAALDANITNASTAGAGSLNWIIWVIIGIVLTLGIAAAAYTLYRKYGKKIMPKK